MRDLQNHSLIFHRELMDLFANFITKEQILLESLSQGIEYRAISRPTFQFLLDLKAASVDLRTTMQVIVVSVGNGGHTLSLINRDEFFDNLFMSHQIRTPSQAPDLDWLIGIPGYIVVGRLERVLSDLDFI